MSMQRPHIVLIHGAWQGSWAFAAWQPMLEAAGWQVHAVDLPGNDRSPERKADATLAGYTAHVCALLAALDAPAVVLGHSGGGLTASQVAETLPDRVRALVYLAGMMLPTGVSFGDVIAQCRAADADFHYTGIVPLLAWDADGTTSRVPPAAAREIFLHDCPPEAAQTAAARLCPQPDTGRDMRNTLSPARFGRVPRVYVECLQDRSVTLPLQRRMQALTPGAHRISLDCGHVPQLACPQALTDALLPLRAMPSRRPAETMTMSMTTPEPTTLPAQGLPPTPEQIRRHLRRAQQVAERAVTLGHHPFGAILVGPDQETVLLEQCNIDTVNHAESTLARVAATNFPADYLWGCTLYTTVEPCCAGTAYWANIGRVVFGMTEHALLQYTGSHAENPTMSVPSRYVFDHCQKAVELIGPVPEMEAEIAAAQRRFWAGR
jgi:pimeloyl-ACP methyl ester carboxylesterase/tRNA(Arg) A34 adenosine deaminase TadA